MLEMLKRMNLQLFAEGVDDDLYLEGEEVITDGEELADEEPYGADEEVEDIDEEEIEEAETLDKKTKSIIKHKKENKELRRQLQELQEKIQADELEKETSNRISELTREGKTSTEAAKIANDEMEVKKLRLQLAQYEINGLEGKYPGISLYSKQLAEDKAKLPEFSYEQLYLAKYAKSSAYDEKTKLEQELLYKTKEARSKSLDNSNVKQQKTTKLSKEDERVYQYLKKSKPNLTRKQYAELLESDTLE